MKYVEITLTHNAVIQCWDVEDNEADRFVLEFQTNASAKIISIKDSEGITYVRPENILVICVNDVVEDGARVGFNRAD